MLSFNPKYPVIFQDVQRLEISILPSTFHSFLQLYQSCEYEQDINFISSLILEDPFLSLKILIKISKRRRTHLNFDIETISKGLMLLGMKEVFDMVLHSSVCLQEEGLLIAIKRAQYAARIGKEFATSRHYVLPEEIQLACLLSDLGELLLWQFTPSIPSSVRNSILSNKFQRNRIAQMSLYGFVFKDLTSYLCKAFELPHDVVDLIEGGFNDRAKLTKTCVEISREIYGINGHLSIAPHIIDIQRNLQNFNTFEIIKPLELSKHFNHAQLQHIAFILKINVEKIT